MRAEVTASVRSAARPASRFSIFLNGCLDTHLRHPQLMCPQGIQKAWREDEATARGPLQEATCRLEGQGAGGVFQEAGEWLVVLPDRPFGSLDAHASAADIPGRGW